jgi:hypothetical protein
MEKWEGQMKPKESRRHCEGRRPVAIHKPYGLPRRFAPRNDDQFDMSLIK